MFHMKSKDLHCLYTRNRVIKYGSKVKALPFFFLMSVLNIFPVHVVKLALKSCSRRKLRPQTFCNDYDHKIGSLFGVELASLTCYVLFSNTTNTSL